LKERKKEVKRKERMVVAIEYRAVTMAEPTVHTFHFILPIQTPPPPVNW